MVEVEDLWEGGGLALHHLLIAGYNAAVPGQAASPQISYQAPGCCRLCSAAEPRIAGPRSGKASSPEPRSRGVWPETTVGTHPALRVSC